MKRKQAYLISVVLTSLFLSPVYAVPPENLTCAKRAVIEYYNSGNFEKDVNATVQNAEKYLMQRLSEKKINPSTIPV